MSFPDSHSVCWSIHGSCKTSSIPCMTRYRNGNTAIMLLNVNSQLAPNGPRLFLLLWYRICAKAVPNDLVLSPFFSILDKPKILEFQKKMLFNLFLILVNSFMWKMSTVTAFPGIEVSVYCDIKILHHMFRHSKDAGVSFSDFLWFLSFFFSSDQLVWKRIQR